VWDALYWHDRHNKRGAVDARLLGQLGVGDAEPLDFLELPDPSVGMEDYRHGAEVPWVFPADPQGAVARGGEPGGVLAVVAR